MEFTPQLMNVTEAIAISVLATVLMVLAFVRGYPIRSIFSYVVIACLSYVSAISAVGAHFIALGIDVTPFSTAATMLRGAVLVFIAALVWYERSHRPRACPYRNVPGSRCHDERWQA